MTQQIRSQSPDQFNLWRSIKRALNGAEEEYTAGGIGHALLLLAIPMVLEMVMEAVFAVVDIFFVAKLGAGAVAAVGITESLLTLIYALAGGFAMATTAVVSRRIGEKKNKEASRAAGQAIILGVAVSAFIAVPAVLFSGRLLALMGADDRVITLGSDYTRIILGGNLVIMLLFLINAAFRGAGNASAAMKVLWLANAVNIVLDPCLIFGWGPFPQLGITGAAIATTIGRTVGVAAQVAILIRGRTRIRIRPAMLIPDFHMIAHLIKISLGGIGQYLIATSSWVVLMRIVAAFGSQALAGYTIAIRIIIFSLLPSWGIANAAATLVGQNLGAGKPERAERSVWISGAVNTGTLFVVALIFLTIPDEIVALFTRDPGVISTAVLSLRIISLGFLFYAMEMVLAQAFNGAGDTRTPTVINFICFWLLEIPLAYLLAMHTDWGVSGVFAAVAISESMAAVIAFALFRRGKWKTTVV